MTYSYPVPGYDPSTDDRPKSALTRDKIRARLEWGRTAFVPGLPKHVRPIPAHYPRFAVDALVAAAVEVHAGNTALRTLRDARDRAAEEHRNPDTLEAEIAGLERDQRRSYRWQRQLRDHFARQDATGAALTPLARPASTVPARLAPPGTTAEPKAKSKPKSKTTAVRKLTPGRAAKVLAQLEADYRRKHQEWQDLADRHGPVALDDAETERHFAALELARHRASDRWKQLRADQPGSAATAEAKRAYNRATGKLYRHRKAQQKQLDDQHLGFVPPVSKTDPPHPEVAAARAACDLAYDLWKDQKRTFARQQAEGRRPAIKRKQAKKRTRTEKKPRPSGSPGTAGRKTPRPDYRSTDADRAKGLAQAAVNRTEEVAWKPMLLFKADADDVLRAYDLLDRMNPFPLLDPGYTPGETFYAIHTVDSGDIASALVTALLHGIDGERLFLGPKSAAHARFRAAGRSGSESFNQEVRPELVAAVTEESLLRRVAPLPGTKRWVFAERWLDPLLEALAATDCPHRVVEFDRHPCFARYKARTLARIRDTGEFVSAGKDTAEACPAYVPEPGEIAPRTGSGNLTPTVGMTAESVQGALDRGVARLRYAPSEGAVTGLAAKLAPRLERFRAEVEASTAAQRRERTGDDPAPAA